MPQPRRALVPLPSVDIATFAALVFAVVAGGVVALRFQLALALGAPWGAYAMGGAFPGRFPPSLWVAGAKTARGRSDRAWTAATA